jgi:peptidoglycan glycosyltransferase
VWIGSDQGVRLYNAGGGDIYGSGLPADIWKASMDGALADTTNEPFPKPQPIAGQAGVPGWSTPFTPHSTAPVFEIPQMTRSYITPFPGVTIPVPGFVPQTQDPLQPTGGGPAPLSGQPTVGDPILDPSQTLTPAQPSLTQPSLTAVPGGPGVN